MMLISLKFFPSFSSHYPGNLAIRHTKHVADLTLEVLVCCIQRADFMDVFSRQFSHAIGLSWRRYKAMFIDLISHVVLVGAQEQVLRVHALRHIAFVKHEHAFGDRTIVVFPGVPMGVNVLATGVAESAIGVSATLDGRAYPQPASVRLIDVLKETFFDVHKGRF